MYDSLFIGWALKIYLLSTEFLFYVMWKACTFWEIVYLLISVISLKPGRKTLRYEWEGVLWSEDEITWSEICMCVEMPLRTVLIYNTQYRQKCKNRYHSTIKMVFCWCCFFTQGIRISYKLARSLFFADSNHIYNRHTYQTFWGVLCW